MCEYLELAFGMLQQSSTIAEPEKLEAASCLDRESHRGVGHFPRLLRFATTQSLERFLGVVKRIEQRIVGRLAVAQMRHQSTGAEMSDPGRVALARQQWLTEAGRAVHHHSRTLRMRKRIIVGLQRIAGKRQRVEDFERHQYAVACTTAFSRSARENS